MRELCTNPLWPCAMTGAASALAGISDLGVIIHGSSGCYIYADMAVPDTLYSTFIVEDEVIFGTSERLCEVLESISQLYKKVAVINTCVPSVMGEDIGGILSDYDVILVDVAGFKGDFDSGWKSAIQALKPSCDGTKESVNIEGICSLDPFYRGNLNEAKRLLDLAKIPVGTTFFHDTYDSVKKPSGYFISANPDYNTGLADDEKSILGIMETEAVFEKLSDIFPDAETDLVFEQTEEADEILTKAGEKFLRKYDPPRIAVFSTGSYTEFACEILKRYLDADIVCAGARNREVSIKDGIKSGIMDHIRPVASAIEDSQPDIIIGSSFEHAKFPHIPFLGLTFPIRHIKMLYHRPLAGIEGSLYFMDSVLNTLKK
ncbi:MAG: oxalate:formate antiporter [Methanomicrobiaceae archaeon]|nr:oxalate:formate antiporter [Methanomicrobiaceae archaeon]